VATYRYLSYTTRTNVPVEPGELPLDVESIRWTLRGGPDELRAKLTLPARANELVDATDPYRRSIYVERDGVLIWGGIITQALDSDDGAELSITAKGFWHYFAGQPIVANLSWLATDTLTVVRGLINWWQAGGGSIAVTVGTETGGAVVNAIYPWYDLKPIGEAVSGLAQHSRFGWSVDVAWEGTPKVPVRRLRLYPGKQGRRFPASGLAWESPGNIVTLPWGRDASGYANLVMTAGQGEGDLMPLGSAFSSASMAAGYPLMINVLSYKDEPSATRLRSWAEAHLPGALDIDKEAAVTVRADVDPIIGSYIPGDEARFAVTSPRFAKGTTMVRKIRAITLHPGSDTAPETATLDLAAVS